MLDVVNGGAQELRDFVFAIAGEEVVEVGVNGRSQGAIVPCPELGNPGPTSFPGHGKDVVGFLEIEGETDSVPATHEVFGIFRPGGILQDGETRQILLEKRRPKEILRGMPKRQRKLRGAFWRK